MRQGAAAVVGLACCIALSAAAAAPLRAQDPDLARELAAGDSAWTRGDHTAAFAHYDAVVRADSTRAPHALLRLGTLHAWAGRMRQAIACHALYVRREPGDLDGRVALGRTYAWASQFARSVAAYDSVLVRAPGHRDAAFGRATTLAWWGRHDQAIAALAAWQRAHPADADAALLRARFLSWDDRLADALALYDSVAGPGTSPVADRGRAQVAAWRGELAGAERAWRALLARDSTDVEAWVGLGQVLRWDGRVFAARDALRRAIAIAPASNEAREQLRWVEAEIEPGTQLRIDWSDDSEENRAMSIAWSANITEPRGPVGLTATARWRGVSQGGGEVTAIPTGGIGARWQPRGRTMRLRAEIGAVSYPAGLAPATVLAQFGAGISGRPMPRLTLGAGAARAPFDEIVSTASRRLMTEAADLDAAWAMRPRLALTLAAGASRVRGDVAPNDERHGSLALRWTPRRSLTAVLSHREVAWDHATPGAFFAPERFALTEASGRWERARDLGLVASLEAGVGPQQLHPFGSAASSRVATRAALRIGWRPRPGREVIAGAQFANVAGAGTVTASDYRSTLASLTARWTF